MKKSLISLIFLAWAAISFAGAEPSAEVTAATKSYVTKNGVVGQFNVTVEKIAGNYARAKVTPQIAGQADPAWVFLKKAKGSWSGITMGTEFSPEDYRGLGIPSSLWVK